MSRGNLLLTAEGDSTIEIGLAYLLADPSLFVGLGQIGRNLTGTLAGLQLLRKELLRTAESLRLLSLLLIGHKVEIGVCLLLGCLSFKCGIDLSDEQVS